MRAARCEGRVNRADGASFARLLISAFVILSPSAAQPKHNPTVGFCKKVSAGNRAQKAQAEAASKKQRTRCLTTKNAPYAFVIVRTARRQIA
jgi:hypothetical protein